MREKKFFLSFLLFPSVSSVSLWFISGYVRPGLLARRRWMSAANLTSLSSSGA
jgi:hypothetical protein